MVTQMVLSVVVVVVVLTIQAVKLKVELEVVEMEIINQATTTPAENSRGEDGVANTGGGGGSFGGSPGGGYADHRGGLGGSGQLVVLEMESLTTAQVVH